jgi:hypothetical protein
VWLLKQQSSIRRFSQIWLHTRYESRQKQKKKKEKKKTRIVLYSWLPTGNYHKILAMWGNKFFEIWLNSDAVVGICRI